ncbi:hypothetical protein C1645_815129 [Glomus cerebriforme]|uniref:Uncharacterized protein n=1 Tax=Glomus cerebriforme TaxID=658196 RepID=A0A397TEC8_9GLOM|nr:hypothetical protein C1645_815129 [Glomus cerebriforme]
MYGLGVSIKENYLGAGPGYMSTFIHKYAQKWCVFIQKIRKNDCIIQIWHENDLLFEYVDDTPLNKENNIIKLTTSMESIYPKKHIFNKRELQAWNTMLRSANCVDVTPFGNDISSYKFWIKFANPIVDQACLKDLYQSGFLSSHPLNIQHSAKTFWNCFAKKFTYHDLQENLEISSHSINAARKFTRINGPECAPLQKVKISNNSHLTQEMQNQFEIFFQDKANVAMSSYKTNLLHELELIGCHMKREYVCEICIENNGKIEHKECIDYCLPYIFGICNKLHTFRCSKCSKFYSFFDKLQNIIPLDQTQTSLLALDHNGTIFIVDYKMHILPKSACETKTEFFGKRGWTLHTVLVYTKSNNHKNLDIVAYNHWSEDTKQDAWFTASSFHAIAHAIKRYIRLGFDVNKEKDIENAIKNLCGTSINQMDPNRNKNKGKIKIFVGISKLNEWQWPIDEQFAGYIQARFLPNIGNFINYSLTQIIQSSTTAIEKPNPQTSTPSIPQSS